MIFTATINVSLKNSILDPQGQTTLHALDSLGIKDAKDLRVGKQFVLKIDSSNKAQAEATADEICKKVLVNPIIEQYFYEVKAEGTSN